MNQEQPGDLPLHVECVAFASFLESTPPSTLTEIADLCEPTKKAGRYAYHKLTSPEIQLHCPNDACNGTRFFRCADYQDAQIPEKGFGYVYRNYVCSNCRETRKVFSLAIQRNEKEVSGRCYKFGELPVYGPPTPSRLIKLVGPDRELLLKGRRCENQGLGIGAFVYYRRVVENQKNRILDQIIKVSEKLQANQQSIEQLTAAKKETQFSKALGSVKDAIPQTLLINGHNPLALLHSALSKGLHSETDEQCLEIASSIRVVLGELSERLAQALKDEAELKQALAKLLESKNDG